jgi:putative ABC transport system permease protein
MTARWLALWSRGLRSEPGRSIAVAILVGLTVLIATSVPRLLSRASDDALDAEVGAASSPVRNLELVQDGRIDAGAADPLALVSSAGTGLELGYPAPIPSLVAGHGLVVDTPLWHGTQGLSLGAEFRLRIQQAIESHIRLVAGRLPTGATRTIDDPDQVADRGGKLTVIETAILAPATTMLGIGVGSQLVLIPESTDPLAARRSIRIAVEIVGTYEVTDPADPYWIDDGNVAATLTDRLSTNTSYLRAVLLLAPTAYPALMTETAAGNLPMIYRWRSYTGPSNLQSGELDALGQALRRAESTYPPVTPTLGNGGRFGGPDQMSPASLRTGLLGLITAHQARWLSGATILTILWTGAGLVILASLALVAEAVARRRGIALALVGRRGASVGQIVSAILSESVILVLPAALLGALLASLLIPVKDQGPSLIVAALGAAGAIAFIAVANRRNRGTDGVERARRLRRLGSGRLVAEALVIGLAVVGAVLLRDRSGGAISTPGSPAAGGPGGGSAGSGPDPFLALAPALVGLAAGVIAVRLLPVILDFVARLLARQRGLVAVLGVRRASRDGSVAAVLVVALTATTVGAFASVLLDQIDAGARSAAWQTVGADFQLTGGAASLGTFEASPPAGVEATAAISTLSVSISTGGLRTLVAIDPAAVTMVARGTPAEPDFPAGMLGPAPPGPLPAIVSSDAGGSSPIVVGQSFSARIDGVAVQLQAVAVRDAYPSVPPGVPFVIVSSRQLSDVPAETAVLARSSTLTLAQLRAGVASLPGVAVQGQLATEADLRDAPVITAVSLGVVSATVAVLVYGLLTIILAIALGTAGRRRETARLQILGLSNRQAISLVFVEFAPVVLIGVAAGLALGFGLISFVGPGLGLPAVLGVAALEPAATDIGRLIAIGAVTLALILAATLLSTVLEQQTQLATAVRD